LVKGDPAKELGKTETDHNYVLVLLQHVC